MDAHKILIYKASYLMGASMDYLATHYPYIHRVVDKLRYFENRFVCCQRRAFAKAYVAGILWEELDVLPSTTFTEPACPEEALCYSKIDILWCTLSTRIAFVNAMAKLANANMEKLHVELDVKLPVEGLTSLLRLPEINGDELDSYRFILRNGQQCFLSHPIFMVATPQLFQDDRVLLSRIRTRTGISFDSEYDESPIALELSKTEKPGVLHISEFRNFDIVYVSEDALDYPEARILNGQKVFKRNIRYTGKWQDCLNAGRQAGKEGNCVAVVLPALKEVLTAVTGESNCSVVLTGQAQAKEQSLSVAGDLRFLTN